MLLAFGFAAGVVVGLLIVPIWTWCDLAEEERWLERIRRENAERRARPD